MNKLNINIFNNTKNKAKRILEILDPDIIQCTKCRQTLYADQIKFNHKKKIYCGACYCYLKTNIGI